jgi:hypothetical protein
MDITVPSGWKVEPGQYVYLLLPQAGLRVASQLPLFMSRHKKVRRGPTAPGHRPQN